MSFIYLLGNASVATYEKVCHDMKHTPSALKCVFLFPGNASHHTNKTTLFSIKGGGGLAGASAAIGNAGYPTLSLPTTGMEQWGLDNEKQQAIVQGALEDLYKAVGAGYHLVLPVRDHVNKKYFSRGLFPSEDLEPSFFGGIQIAANIALADYYTKQLDDLYRFMALAPQYRVNKAEADPDVPFYHAYLQGQLMSADDPWLMPNKKPAAVQKKALLPQQLISARNLLNDYTKDNSAIKRFFSGHWNRHHVNEVHKLVKQIDQGVIKDVTALIEKLDRIKLVNQNGSLARRIHTIKDRNKPEDSAESSILMSN